MLVRRSRTPRRRLVRRTMPAILIAAAALLATGCGSGDTDRDGSAAGAGAATASSFPVTIQDAAGTDVEITERPERIVALFDVNVATLDELEVDDRIVGIDDFAAVPGDTPDDVPRIGGDNFVFDADAVVALEPDLVITSTGTEEVLDAQLRNAGLTVLSLGYPNSLDETWALVEALGDATGEAGAADELAGDLRERIDAVAAVVDDADPVSAYYETDASTPGKPYTVGDGSLVGELLQLAGGENVFGDDGLAPQVSLESIVAAKPSVILLGNAEGHVGPNFFGPVDLDSVAERAGFATIPAVADDRVVAIDADELLVPGPRLPEGLAQLVAALHPDRADAAEDAASA